MANVTRTFLREELVDAIYEASVLDEITDTSRWSVYHRFVFKAEDDGKFYETHYSVGATEYQDEQPWQDENEVECIEVVKVEKIVQDFEPR